MTINIDNQFIFIFNISLSVFIGVTVYSLTNEWVKKGVNWIFAALWKIALERWIMRNPPSIEVLALFDDGNQSGKIAYLDLDKYLKTQASMPGSTLQLAVYVRGKHQNFLYGKKLNLDFMDSGNLLGAMTPSNGILLPGKVLRVVNEHLLSGDYSALTCDLSVMPKGKITNHDVSFRYQVLGTKISGTSVLKVSTGSRPK